MTSLWRAGVWFAHGYKQFGRNGYLNQARNWDPKELEQDLSGKVYLVTGANSGLGRSTATALAKRGGRVYLLCRDPERGEKARQEIVEETGNKDVHLEILDVSKQSSIGAFVKKFTESGEKCDVLVNNAGVMPSSREESDEGLELTFATNTVGTFLLTNLMLPVLQRSAPSRVITVSSGGALTQKMDVDDFQFKKVKKFDGTLAYAQTKRAQLYLNELFAEKYKDSSVYFYSMHPGWADTPGVQTSMPGFYDKMKDNLRTSDEGADTIVWLAITDKVLDEKHNGKFFLDRHLAETHLSWTGTASPRKDIDKLWEVCSEVTGWESVEGNEEWLAKHAGAAQGGEKKKKEKKKKSKKSKEEEKEESDDSDKGEKEKDN